MRIALITDGVWPYVMGGMQKHSFYLCKYFAKDKIQVDLFHFNDSKFDITKLEFFSDEEKKYITSYIVPFPKAGKLPGHYIKNSKRHSKLIYNIIKDKLSSYNFIYSKGFTAWHLINLKHAGKINCCPIGVKFHGYEMFQKPPNFKIYLQQVFLLRKPVKDLSLKADIVFSYGGKITEIIKTIGVPPSKIIELPSGVEQEFVAENYSLTKQPINFLYLGRYERRKGIEEINSAIKNSIATNNTNCVYNFIGNIPQEKKIKSEHVNYFGEIRDKTKLLSLIKENDVLLCPSYSEGMPNVILEAMSNGLTVLCTNVGANGVLVNISNGFMIEACNASSLEKKINEISNLPSAEIDLKKQNALTTIKEKFIWEKLIAQLLSKIN